MANSLSAENFEARLDQASCKLDIKLNTSQIDAIYLYWQLFIKWNRAYNLSAIRNEKEILYKHIVDSLAIMPSLQTSSAEHIIDVGTGGGLPGIPLSICFPERQFTLLDSAGKKMRFLFQVRESLDLSNVTLENCRVEALNSQQKYDVVISRAFASLKKFTSICSGLVDDHGELWAMKGHFPSAELSEIEKHYIVREHIPLDVPGIDGERCLLKICRRQMSQQAIT